MNILNAALLNSIVNVINALSSVLDLPGKVLSVIALPSAIIAYFSGRRRRLFESAADSANEALLAEVRQGFQTLAAAIAAVSAAEVITWPGGVAPAAPPLPSAPHIQESVTAPARPAPPQQIPPVAKTLADLPLTIPTPTIPAPTTRHGVRYRALAICSGIGLAMTLCWVGSYIIYGQYTGLPEADLLADANYGFFNTVAFLGLFVTLIAMVWACVKALRIGQPRWAVGLFLGTVALAVFTLLTMPGLLILIFAIWGPGKRPAKVVPPSESPVAAAPELAGVTAGMTARREADDTGD